MNREPVLARTMVELVGTLVDEFDIDELLSTLATGCVDVLPVAAAEILLIDADGRLRPVRSSDDTLRRVELDEIQAQEGPGLECVETGLIIVDADLTSSHGHWPRFAPVAVEAGYRSIGAIPMRQRNRVIGALNLFDTQIGSLSNDELAVAQALADVTTITILQRRDLQDPQVLDAQMSAAMSSRVAIQQAVGVIAERRDLSGEDAARQLRHYARKRDLRVAHVARDVVSGDLDIDELTP